MSELEQIRRRLEQAERLLNCFQQALGHELPNQLVAIQGLLRVLALEERDRLGPESREYLERVTAAARRVHELVRALAELGRTARDDQPAETISLAEAISEAAAEVKLLYPDYRIEYDFSHPAPALTVPRPALHRVLVQLLGHASRAGTPDRPIRVRVGARSTDAGVEFWVADDGVGLSPAQQRQLFEPFAGPDRPEGAGELGLFLVRHIIEGWGGTINVRSEPGQGTTFTITVRGP
ncbi:MAG TPA: HAMP domain-containing sensor histidine kinase [Gemmataceae bacterium]|nr:HAMP domain-containing sensor histidine kinase [Gemmataceae bacterium]